jgi:hypothetical protein
VVQNALKIISNSLGTVKIIVAHFKKSTLSTEKLLQDQQSPDQEHKKITERYSN